MSNSYYILSLCLFFAACGKGERQWTGRRGGDSYTEASAAEKAERKKSGPDNTSGEPGNPPKIEVADEPQVIAGYNLTFDRARPRCTSEPSKRVPGQYQVTCLAVEMVNGSEQIPTKPADGVTLAWERPTASVSTDFNIESCSTTSQNLAQNCVIRVPISSKTVNVTFQLTLTESLAGKDPRKRTDSDVVILPYSVQVIGYVPEIPQLVSTAVAPNKEISSIGALRLQDESMLVGTGWVFASQKVPLEEFPITNDSQVLYCGKHQYLTSRSRLFVVENDAIKHIAGSINERNLDDLSHPLRTYWKVLAGLACQGDHVLIETRGPTRIYDISPEGTITLVAKDHLDVLFQETSSLAVDAKGNIYFLDGLKIRRRTPAGSVEVVYDGTEVLLFPWSFGIDQTTNGEVKAFVVLDIGTGGSPTVVSIDVASGALRTLAGNASFDPPPVDGIRSGVAATDIALGPLTRSLSLSRSPTGQRLLLVGDDTTLLAVDPAGIAHVLLRSETNITLKTKPTATATTVHAFLAGGSGDVTMTPQGKVLAKVTLKTPSETTSSYVTMPLAGGDVMWAAGRIPLPYAPLGPKVAAAKALLSGTSLTTFGPDGTLYVIDNGARAIFRLEGDSLVRLPLQFEGKVLSATVERDMATNQNRLAYTELVDTRSESRVQSVILSDKVGEQPKTLISTPACDIKYPSTSYFATVKCSPAAIAVDAAGRIVFFDRGYRLIRRRETSGSFTTLAGNQDLKAAQVSRSAGTTHKPTDFGISWISTLRFDPSGALIFVERGGQEQIMDGADPVTFTPLVGRLDTVGPLTQRKISVLVGSGGDQPATALETKNEIPTTQFQLQEPLIAAPLFDGSLLFTEGDVVLQQRGNVITRFFGGKLANADCGAGTLDRVAATAGVVPTLNNALGRFCAGHIAAVNSTGTCSEGKTLIAMAQGLGTNANDAGNGWVLRVEAACNTINTK